MKLITIGSDRKLFEDGSAVRKRSMEYAGRIEESHIIVFTLATDNFVEKKIDNLYIHPTNSSSRYQYVFDAYAIGKKIIRELGFVRGASVISTQDPFESGLVGYFLKRKFRLPLHVQAHTDFFSPFFADNFLNRLRVKIANFVIPAANSIRVVSADIAKNIRNKFPNIKAAVFVLPVFVNLSEFENAQKSERWTKIFSHFKFVILMVSRLSPEKKIETALRAVSQLVATYNFLGLAIAGDGIEKDRLEKMAENLGISQNVMFLGWQDNPASLFKSADVFLSTSAFEGYGMAVLEAASAGCPIVSTGVGLAKEMCRNGENSFVCPVDDDNCVAEAISRLIQNEGLRLSFSREMSKESAKHLISENDYVNRYIEELTRLVPLDNQSESIQK